MTSGSQAEYIQYRIERSKELLEDSRILASNHRWRSCVNRLYYSSFHLIISLLSLDNITTKTHEGLKTKFLQLYIKTKKIDKQFGKLYTQLIDWRQESDYAALVQFDKDDVLPLIDKVEVFNSLLIGLIKARS